MTTKTSITEQFAPGPNPEAERYYQITEDSYLSLTDRARPFMNLGYWRDLATNQPLATAQLRLAETTIDHAITGIPELTTCQGSILEVGPGWGGSRAVLQERLPAMGYVGLNCSARQVAFAATLNAAIPRTDYRVGFVEEFTGEDLRGIDMVFGIESLLHVKEKGNFFALAAKSGVKAIVLAEICLEDERVFGEEPLFNPALRWTVSTNYYESALKGAGFDRVMIRDIGADVFAPWVEALKLRQEARDTSAHPRILRDFVRSYTALAEFHRQGRVTYPLIAAYRTPDLQMKRRP